METQPKKEINYWFVDAGYKSFEDRKRLSLADKKIWLCNNDYYSHLVKTMQPGDKIALKSHFFRKYDLPFNNKGQDVPIMSIEAIGVVVKNFNDGKKVSVVWNKYESPREWYFYSSQALVFCIQKGTWMSDNLLAFTFEQHSQDLHRFLLTPYWHDRFNDTQPYFFWSTIGESLSKRLIEFHHKRDKFIPLLHLLFKQIDHSGLLLTHQQLVSAHDMDPFAILELCFRALINKKISGNVDELVKFFAIDPICLNVKQGIPFIDPEKQRHFFWTLEPDELRINILWQLLDVTLHYTDNQDLQARSNFIDVLEQARQFYSLENITLALSWIKPWTFLSLNKEVIRRLPKDIAEFIQNSGLFYSQDVRHYLELIETLDYHFLCGKFSINSFPALTQYVYQTQITKPTESLKIEAQKPTIEAKSNSGSFVNLESIGKHDLSHSDDTDMTLDFHLTNLSNTEILNGVKEATEFAKRINKLTEKEDKSVLNQPTMLDETDNVDTIQTDTISSLIFDSDIYQSMAFEFGIDSDNSQLENNKPISFDSVMNYPTMLDYEMDADVIQSGEIKPLSVDSEVHHSRMLDYEIEADVEATQPEEIKPLSVDSDIYQPTMLDDGMNADAIQSGEVKPLISNSEAYHPTMLDDEMNADITQTMRVTPLVSNTHIFNPTRLEHNESIETDNIQAEILLSVSHDLDYIKPTLQAEETESNIPRSGTISPFTIELDRTEPTPQTKETEAEILLTGIISPLSIDAEHPLQVKETQVDVISSKVPSPLSVVLNNSKPQLQSEQTEADILLTGIISPLSIEAADTEPLLQATETSGDVISSKVLSPLSIVLDDSKPQLQPEETEADILQTGIISPLPIESTDAESPLQAKKTPVDVISSEVLSPLSVVLDDSKPQPQLEETEADILMTGIISPLTIEAADTVLPLQAKETPVDVISSEVLSPLSIVLDDGKPQLQSEETEADILLTGIISSSPLVSDAVKPLLQTEEFKPTDIPPEFILSSPFELDAVESQFQAEEFKSANIAPKVSTPLESDAVEPQLQAEEFKSADIAPEVSAPLELDAVKPQLQAEEFKTANIAPKVSTPLELDAVEPQLQAEEFKSADIAPEVLSSPLESDAEEPLLQVEEFKSANIAPKVLTPLESDAVEPQLQVEEFKTADIAPEVSSQPESDAVESQLQAEEFKAADIAPEVSSQLESDAVEPQLQAEEFKSADIAPEVLSSPLESDAEEPLLQVEEFKSANIAPKVLTPLESDAVEPQLQVEEFKTADIAPKVSTPFESDVVESQRQAEEFKAADIAPEVSPPLESDAVEPQFQAEEFKAADIAPEASSPFESDAVKSQLQAEEFKAADIVPEISSPLGSDVVKPKLQAEEFKAADIAPEVSTPLESDAVEPQFQAEEFKAADIAPEVSPPLESDAVDPQLQAEGFKAADIAPEVSPPLESDAVEPQLQAEESKAADIALEVSSPLESDAVESQLQAEEFKAADIALEVSSPLESDALKPQLQAEEFKAADIAPEASSSFESDAVESQLQAEEFKAADIALEVSSPLELDAVKQLLQTEENKVDSIPSELLLPLLINLEDNEFIQRSKGIETDISKVDSQSSLPSNSNDYESVVPINEIKSSASRNNETKLVEKQNIVNKSIVNNSLEQDRNPSIIKENDQHLSKRRTKASAIINSVKQALAALSIYHTDEQSTKSYKTDNDFSQLLTNEKFTNNDLVVKQLLGNSQEISGETDNNDTPSPVRNDVSYNKAAVLDLLANYKEKDIAETSLSHSSTESSIVGSSLHAIGHEPSRSQTKIDEKTAIKESHVETALDNSQSKSDTSTTINIKSATSTDSRSYTIFNDCFFDEPLLQDIICCLKDKHNLVLQGPAGTGKSWLARRLAFFLTESENSHNIYTLQSHPNLSYERFIGQLYIDNQGNQKIKEGIFLSLIKSAQRQPEIGHVLIIEDIHRINPTEIFGDLFSLLDINQRTEDNAIIFCPSENGKENSRILIPTNVYIIATMNMIPSCLYSMGYEWRRPFAFVSLEPQINERWCNWLITHCNVNPSLVMDIQQRLLELNQMIAADSHLGRHCCIGHSYVTPNKPLESDDTRNWFKRVVEMEIAPLLDLYWSDRPEYALQAKKRLLEGW